MADTVLLTEAALDDLLAAARSQALTDAENAVRACDDSSEHRFFGVGLRQAARAVAALREERP